MIGKTNITLSGGSDADLTAMIDGSLSSITNNASVIRQYAFERAYSLITASFPSCTSIGPAAFENCSRLTTISFPVCTTIGKNAFNDCRSLTTISFPACTVVGSSAFFACRIISEASFPVCTNIGTSAFYSCSSLYSLYLLGSSVAQLGGITAFDRTPISVSTSLGFGSIFVRASLLTAWQTATNWATYSARFVGLTDAEIEALDNQ